MKSNGSAHDTRGIQSRKRIAAHITREMKRILPKLEIDHQYIGIRV